MPQSEMIAAKRRALAGQGSTGSGKSAPGAHTKYDPTNHAVVGEPGGEYKNTEALDEHPPATGLSGKQGLMQRLGLQGAIAKPSDTSVAPLSGEGHPHFTEATELKGVANQLASLSSIFANMLVELAAQRPSLPLILDGPAQTNAGKNTDYDFLLDNKKVPSLNLFLYNNTGQTVNVAFSTPATAGDIPLLNGATLRLNDVKVDYISFYTAVVVNIVGIRNSSKPANGLIIYAWGNPEWRHFSGEI